MILSIKFVARLRDIQILWCGGWRFQVTASYFSRGSSN